MGTLNSRYILEPLALPRYLFEEPVERTRCFALAFPDDPSLGNLPSFLVAFESSLPWHLCVAKVAKKSVALGFRVGFPF